MLGNIFSLDFVAFLGELGHLAAWWYVLPAVCSSLVRASHFYPVKPEGLEEHPCPLRVVF